MSLALAQQLSILLSNTFVFSNQLHGFHWCYTGAGFIYLHPFLGEDYSEVYNSVDDYAEFILKLGYEPPTRLSEYLQLATTITERPKVEDPEKILHIAYSHHKVLAEMTKSIFDIATECGSNDVANYLADKQGYHDKKSWFYRAELGVKVPSIFEASKPALQTSAIK